MSIAKKTIASASALIAGQLVQRLLGVISMITLARLLTPDDFGIVSVATIAVFFLETLTSLGGRQYVAKVERISDSLVNTAWTLSVITRVICWIILFSGAELIANFLDKPETATAIKVLSTILLISCFGNPGMMILARQLNYKPNLTISIVSKTISFIFVVVTAYFTQSYWAMIYGTLISYAIPSVMSHFYTQHKPKFSLDNVRAQWHFSKWVLARALLGFSNSQVDSIIVSKFYSLDTIGIYGMFKNLAMMPATIFIKPATQPLLSSFSRIRDESGILPYHINASVLLLNSIVIPLVIMMMLFHNDIVLMILGESWRAYAAVFACLAPMLITHSIVVLLSELVIAKHKIHNLFYFDFFSVCICTSGLLLFSDSGIIDFAIIRTIISFITTVLFLFFFTKRDIGIGLSTLKFFSIPLLAALFPSYVFYEGYFFWKGNSPVMNLFINCSFYSTLYSIALISFALLIKNTAEIKMVASVFLPIVSKAIGLLNIKQKQ